MQTSIYFSLSLHNHDKLDRRTSQVEVAQTCHKFHRRTQSVPRHIR